MAFRPPGKVPLTAQREAIRGVNNPHPNGLKAISPFIATTYYCIEHHGYQKSCF